ncbi:MAG: hypothetical protein WCC17_10475 [Candidatus Nitrosopolaris sp.]
MCAASITTTTITTTTITITTATTTITAEGRTKEHQKTHFLFFCESISTMTSN